MRQRSSSGRASLAVGRRVIQMPLSEKDIKLAQKLGQPQPFIVVFPQECMGQLVSFAYLLGQPNTFLALSTIILYGESLLKCTISGV
jgi:hypothetical protein